MFADAQAMLKRIIEGKWLRRTACSGCSPPTASRGDDIEIYADETREQVLMTWHNLRQQNEKARPGNPNLCLADFIAPKTSGVPDYIGAFAVTAGIGIEKRARGFEKRTTTTARSC